MDAACSGLSVVDSVPRIAAAMGQARSTTDTLVRLMQRHDPPLFPIPKGRGGGKNAARHTLTGGTNLVLGLALQGQAVVDRPALILPYRKMPAVAGTRWSIGLDPGASGVIAEAVRDWTHAVTGAAPNRAEDFRLVPGDTLGEACDNLTDWIAQPEGQTIRNLFRKIGLFLDICVASPCQPCLFACDTKGAIATPTFFAHHPSHTLPSNGSAADEVGLTITARVQFKVFEVLADLWSELRPRHCQISGQTAFKAPLT